MAQGLDFGVVEGWSRAGEGLNGVGDGLNGVGEGLNGVGERCGGDYLGAIAGYDFVFDFNFVFILFCF